MNYTVFIAYSGADEKYASYIYSSLDRINEITPYKAEIFLNYGEDFKTRLEKALSDSTFMIVLLTEKGVSSQWVNQEIGYAQALKKRKGMWSGLPHIIPISRTTVKLTGFITKDTIDILYIDKFQNFEYVMTNIILSIRIRILNGLRDNTLSYIVTCSCYETKGSNLPFEYSVIIPSHDDIVKAIKSNNLYREVECPRCQRKNYVDVRTFLPTSST